jgi:hypothetical protein
MNEKQCPACEENKETGFNYCRSCGLHLTKGQVQQAHILRVYQLSEKFCGHCGKPRTACEC